MSTSIATSTAVDLSRLPPPDVIEQLDYETILAQLLASLTSELPELAGQLLESDPAVKLLQIVAFRELLLRQQFNDRARANMIAYAMGADLENLAALFGVSRLVITPANAQTGAAAIFEDDTALRRRVLLAPDSYSVAGPASAYVFHALSASSEVLDASATSPAPGEVLVSLLARSGNGTASAAVIAAVAAVLTDDEVRPLTDQVTVQSAAITSFDIEAELTLFAGPDASLILAEAQARLAATLANSRRVGRDVTRSAIFAALHVAGVQNVDLISPAADIVVGETGAAHAASISVIIEGTGE